MTNANSKMIADFWTRVLFEGSEDHRLSEEDRNINRGLRAAGMGFKCKEKFHGWLQGVCEQSGAMVLTGNCGVIRNCMKMSGVPCALRIPELVECGVFYRQDHNIQVEQFIIRKGGADVVGGGCTYEN